MKAVPVKAAALLVGVLAVQLGLPERAPAQAFKRSEALEAFNRLERNAKKGLADAKAKPQTRGVGTGTAEVIVTDRALRFVPVQVGTEPDVKTMIKVWAAPVKDKDETGDYVHLSKYKWQKKERFYLYFESAVPVQIGLYQDYPEASDPNKKTRQVMPDPAFPDSYQTIMPGQPYRFPILMEMDDNLEPEYMAIVVSAVAGLDQVINKPDPGTGTDPGGATRLAKAQKEGIDKLYKDIKGKPKARFNASVDPVDPNKPVDPGSKTSSKSPDDVAIIAFGPENYGYILLKLHKD
jgi:hypothetical protein